MGVLRHGPGQIAQVGEIVLYAARRLPRQNGLLGVQVLQGFLPGDGVGSIKQAAAQQASQQQRANGEENVGGKAAHARTYHRFGQ